MAKVKLTPWQMAAIEAALKEKTTRMADKESWERLTALIASAEAVSIKQFEHNRA